MTVLCNECNAAPRYSWWQYCKDCGDALAYGLAYGDKCTTPEHKALVEYKRAEARQSEERIRTVPPKGSLGKYTGVGKVIKKSN